MTITLSTLRSWDPPSLAGQGDRLGTASAALDDQLNAISRAVDTAMQSWHGATADAAAARLTALHAGGNRASTALVGLADTLPAAGSDLAAMRAAVLSAVDAATAAGFGVAEDGAVTAPTVPASPDQAATQDAANADATAHRDTIGRALAAVADADARWAGELGRAVDAVAESAAVRGAGPTGISPGVQAILDGTAQLPSDPAALNARWQSLTPEDKEALYAQDHNIGNRPGIPTIDRDHFNERHLVELQAQAQTTVQAITAEHPDWARGVNIPPEVVAQTQSQYAQVAGPRIAYMDWLARREAAQTSLAGYDAVSQSTGQGPTGAPPRYLLGIDTSDRAIIATGNPDTARNVATFVPGTGTTLSGIGRDAERGDAMRRAAGNKGDPDTAVVTWYGYNAPQDLQEATGNSHSDAGAADLEALQDGLRVTHDGAPSHNTVLGHSYGTTLVGAAATGSNTLNADDVVLVASPGARGDSAADFHLDGQPRDTAGQHVWATAAKYDPVPLYSATHALGGDPPDPAYGDRTFASDPGSPGLAVHSQYWDPGNIALTNMGRIIAGAYDQVAGR